MFNKHTHALQAIYQRTARPDPERAVRDLPWHDPAFSERLLLAHLDETDGAASRIGAERSLQIDWLWQTLDIQSTSVPLFDVTCGPGLYAVEFARRGCRVIGIDISPAAVDYARQWALSEGMADLCRFEQSDIRHDLATTQANQFQAAILLYGQLELFTQTEAQLILNEISRTLGAHGRLCLEILNPEVIDRAESSWWYTDQRGLWGDEPYLHLGERFWFSELSLSIERYQIIHLADGRQEEFVMCNQSYTVAEMTTMLRQAGFQTVTVHPAWDGLPRTSGMCLLRHVEALERLAKQSLGWTAIEVVVSSWESHRLCPAHRTG